MQPPTTNIWHLLFVRPPSHRIKKHTYGGERARYRLRRARAGFARSSPRRGKVLGRIDRNKKREIDDLALKSFCSGLPIYYHPYINSSTCKTLREAYDRAIQLHAAIQYERDRRGLVRPQPQRNPGITMKNPWITIILSQKKKQ